MAIKKKNKFVVPQEYNKSVIFSKGGNLYSGIQSRSNQMNIIDNFGKNGNVQAGIGQSLGVAQGVMQLGSQAINNLDTSGIGGEVIGTNDISRNDILNTNVNVDSRQSNVGGQALSGAITGAQAGMAFGPWGCVCAGTRVITNSGKFLNIEDLVISDGIVGWDGNSYTKQNINAFHKPSKKECVEIITLNGKSLKCSIDHPIVHSIAGRSPREYVVLSDGSRKRTRVKSYKWTNAQNIKVGDSIATISNVPIFGNVEMKFPRLIGLLIGDGTYGINHGTRLSSADESTWKYIEDNFSFSFESRKLDGYKEFRTYFIKGFVPYMRELSIYGQTRENKRLPENIHIYNKESICEMIGGLFDSDGHIFPKRNRAFFSQSNLSLIKQVQELLIKIGVQSTITSSKGGVSIFPNLKEYRSKTRYKLNICDRNSFINFYENVKLSVPYKQDSLNFGYKMANETKRKINCIDSISFETVKSIKNIGTQYVYNLEAAGSHTYIANLIVTHNSAIGGVVGGLSGGISSIIGNDQKQHKAQEAEQQWTNNLQAKNRQFNQQDLRTNMANFSANGGDLFAYGGQMPKQLTEFNAGGTHEQNINSGIMQGTGANGQPNLVEQGETKHEDYIFSDRLKINPIISGEFKLPKGLNGKTFAQASKYLNREAKDRPNDPISNNAVKAHLAKLTAAQEGLKAQQQPQQGIPMEGQPNANILAQGYANGGYIDQTHYNNPTLQGANIGAMGGNLHDGTNDSYLTWLQPQQPQQPFNMGIKNQMFPIAQPTIEKPWAPIKTDGYFPQSIISQKERPFVDTSVKQNATTNNPTDNNITDFSRYAPVAANIAMGIGDMFEKPEVVKYGRVNPERVTARMDYQPIDTEWMNNKMNATYAGTRDQMINNSGGNRAMAMAGLSGINQQQQNAVGEAYMKAQDINYGRKNQATQFNAGIEAQNVVAQNAAQQANLQLQMQEMDANARNRAAKRNAARQAILNAASNVGDIGRENYFGKLTTKATGYNPMDALKYSK